MNSPDTFDLDGATDRAWRQLRRRLADHLAAMDDDDTLVVGVEAGDAGEIARYVQFAVDDDQLAFEVSSNEVLTGVHRLGPDAEMALASMGLVAPTRAVTDTEVGGSPNHHLHLPRTKARKMAALAVTALRDVLGVPHPAFLSHPALAGDDDEPAAAPTTEVDVDGLVAITPQNRAHLQALVDQALTPVLGQPPDHDDDDDVVVARAGSPIFVRVLPGAPLVQLFTLLVEGVEDLARAAFEITVLHRDHPFVRFVLTGGNVLAYLNVPGFPFLPVQLRSMFDVMADLDDEARDVAFRVGGHPVYVDWDEHHEAAWEEAGQPLAHPALRTIRALEDDEPGSVDADLAASICGHDRDLLLQLLADCATEEEEWLERIDDAQAEDDEHAAGLCERHRAEAAETASLLRRALRVVVEAEQGARRSRPRPVRRPPEDGGPTPAWLETG